MQPITMDTGVIFFPRGGSAQVIRYLSRELNARGFTTRLHAGSLGDPGDPGHAATFYAGLDLQVFDYNAARDAWQRGKDPQMTDRPFHPSYEDRGTSPDPMFAAVPPLGAARLTVAWQQHLVHRRSPDARLLHLHHLSHLQGAASRAYPGVPLVTTLHGTELKQIEGMARRLELARRLTTSVETLADVLPEDAPYRSETVARLVQAGKLDDAERQLLDTTQWHKWRHSAFWHKALTHAVTLAGQIVTVSEHDRDLAYRLLPALGDQEVSVVTNGVDTSAFRPCEMADTDRMANLRHWLITDPQGWAAGQGPGSIRYTDADLNRLWDVRTGNLRPIILWVGRFLDFKRVPVLMRAFARARARLDPAPALIMWGGYPAECEGQHPAEICADLGIEQDVYLAGWRGHDELPTGLNCADLMVAPAVGEPFGMVYIEAQACGTPPIATATGGPLRTITPTGPGANGWLVRPDDSDDLADTIVQAVADHGERARRGANGQAHAHGAYGWGPVADRYSEVYERALDHAPAGTVR